MNPLFASLSNIISGAVIMWVTNRCARYATSPSRTAIYRSVNIMATVAFVVGLVSLVHIFFA